MIETSLDNSLICWKCVKDAFAQKWIGDEGKGGTCSYCGKNNRSIPITKLADYVHEVFQNHYGLTPDTPSSIEHYSPMGWWRDGDEPEISIGEMLRTSDEIVKDIVGYLSELHGYLAVKEGLENPYGAEARYELKAVADHDYRESWEFFCHSMKEHSRFFNEDAEGALSEIFDGIIDQKTWDGEKILKKIGPDGEDQRLYRARLAPDINCLQKTLIRPDLELAAPPSAKARAGRMNAAGVSVFYGSFEAETCITELRPPVGSHVVVGTFEAIRPLLLLDMQVLEKILVEVSHFDPMYEATMGRAAFLRRFTKELAKPILPHDEEFGYIPTQAVAEYIAEKIKPSLNGIVYPSTQVAGGGSNIVLFHFSSRVERWADADTKEAEIDWGWVTEDDCDDTISIWEQPKPSNVGAYSDKEISETQEILSAIAAEWGGDAEDPRPPVLRLIRNEIQCHRIMTAKYKTSNRCVSRYEVTQDNNSSF